MVRRMPWLAVPLDDKESRNQLSKLACKTPKFIPVCAILDAIGKVLGVSAITEFVTFGAEWYPFTLERISQIVMKDWADRFAVSVTSLLTSPSRDFFLLTNDGKKVPASELEGKVVGFYFYSNFSSHYFVPKLIKLYKEVRQKGENFEIVLIRSRCGKEEEELFMRDFQSMPRLALSPSERSYSKLSRTFSSNDGDLVIVRPGEILPDEYGMQVIEEYGIEAYPFTRQRVLPSDLVGKNVLLLLTKQSSPECTELLPKMMTWYDEIKRKLDETFEVIHVACDYDQSLVDEYSYGKMPWLEFPFDEDYNKSLYKKTLNVDSYDIPMLVAFGPDGRILSRNAETEFELNGTGGYPFSDDEDFFREIHWDIASAKMWPVTDENGYSFMVV